MSRILRYSSALGLRLIAVNALQGSAVQKATRILSRHLFRSRWYSTHCATQWRPEGQATSVASKSSSGTQLATTTPTTSCSIPKRVTITTIRKKHQNGEQIVMLTAYDALTGAVVDDVTSIDMLLVGDSLTNTALGQDSTTRATMESMVHHCRAVTRAARRPLIVFDMPFGSYEVSDEEAVRSAIIAVRDAGAHAVKLEGGGALAASRVRAISAVGIPVIAHIGLTPQRINALGGCTFQGKTANDAQRLLSEALELQGAGAVAIVLECVTTRVAAAITAALAIPTIGIGSGPYTSGQVLVFSDVMGLQKPPADGKPPMRFVKRYADCWGTMTKAAAAFARDVIEHRFPESQHALDTEDAHWKEFMEKISPEHRKILERVMAKRAEKSANSGVKKIVSQREVGSPNLTLAVVGCGAMGGAIAASLASRVYMGIIDHNEQTLKRISTNGLALQRPSMELIVDPKMLALGSTAEGCLRALGNPVDAALICVKSWQTHAAAEQADLMRLVRAGGAVITLQNGIGHMEVLEKMIMSRSGSQADKPQVVQGVTSLGAMRLEPGRVALASAADGATLGVTTLLLTSRHSPSVRSIVKNVAEAMNAVGLPAEVFDATESGDEENSRRRQESLVWCKLVVSAAVNSLTALLKIPNGTLAAAIGAYKDTVVRQLLRNVIQEAVAVAVATGRTQLAEFVYPSVAEKGGSIVDIMVAQAEEVLRRTANNKSSMLSDILRGGRTEVDAINGAVVAEGERVGVNVATNKLLWQLIKATEAVGNHSA